MVLWRQLDCVARRRRHERRQSNVLGDLSGEWLPFEEVYNGKELWVVKGTT